MHPVHHAAANPEKPCCVMADTGESLNYQELDAASNRGAHLLRSLGLQPGDVMAVMLDNEISVFEIAWAAQRAGIYLTSLSTRLSGGDIAYILADSGARVLVVSDRLAPLTEGVVETLPDLAVFSVSTSKHFQSWKDARGTFPSTPIDDEHPGGDMLYSSGTTGRPKGVKPPLPQGAIDAPTPLTKMGDALYAMDSDTVYLSTSPLYHAAPLRWAMTIHRLGGTVVIMERFDAEQALHLIEKHGITHATWVPTHFTRLLKLPVDVRNQYDHRSLVAIIHAAAPCPVPVKSAMIDWWGPIVHEYYSGTESCGITALSSEEWLRKPGSVGRAVLGTLKILDSDGEELPPGQIGDIYFAEGPKFEYHNDPQKTANAYNDRGWATLGDIGHIDEDGYLFLSDRKNFMIISGGVNIYPQEIENLLVTHPKVADVAVVGVENEDLGEVALAVVQLMEGIPASASTEQELIDFSRAALGSVKTPKQFVFRSQLPREPTGKLLKAALQSEVRTLARSGILK